MKLNKKTIKQISDLTNDAFKIQVPYYVSLLSLIREKYSDLDEKIAFTCVVTTNIENAQLLYDIAVAHDFDFPNSNKQTEDGSDPFVE